LIEDLTFLLSEMMRSCLLVALCALFSVAQADIILPKAISSNMVLQRAPQSASIWGRTTRAGDIVTAMLDNVRYRVFSNSTDGSWIINFDPQPASIKRTIKLGDADEQVILSNIAFGDVYICSGQSNMEFTVVGSFDNETAIPDSANYPNLRLFSIAEWSSLTPVNDTINRFSDNSSWVVSGPEYVGGPQWDFFSATCYYFARELYKAVNIKGSSVPIGVMETCWGGTRIEAWTTQEGLDKCGPVEPAEEFMRSMAHMPEAIATDTLSAHTRLITNRRHARRSAMSTVDKNPDPQTPSVLYNGMIAPITNMKVRGAIWYQGEANVGNATNYACRFPAMINDWREQFNNYNMWFGFVLLAAYREGGNPAWPLIRDAQTAALSLPLVHVGSAQDLGDELSPEGGIHPRNKTLVGYRLSLGARATVYQQPIISTGPSVADIIWPVDSSSTQSVILRFASGSSVNQGLAMKDTSGCSDCCRNINGSALTVGTSDGEWRRAHVTVSPVDYLVVATVNDLPAGVNVVSVQHGYEDYQECAIYNSANLPLLPLNVTRF